MDCLFIPFQQPFNIISKNLKVAKYCVISLQKKKTALRKLLKTL
ncbi:hypothetical protein KR50_19540 [Jeotgalibacillus campisalis]|uniref:Uncharacterized protein n=1 Tax=Jeotgalibacillus campisalis TaxID=220754 RepID=A0A0C2VFX0_9BACL|nr:hypothetical protein KR50_19540 [Jeotgalibacillus campisalis]